MQRIISIRDYKKSTRTMVALMLVIAIALTGCATAIAAVGGENMSENKNVEQSNYSTSDLILSDEWLPFPENTAQQIERRGDERMLTIDDLIRLSIEKGEELDWSDFSEYASSEIGSGLYILAYEIEDAFTLYITGDSGNTRAISIRLFARGTDASADVRIDDVAAYVERHMGAALDAAVSAAILNHFDAIFTLDADGSCESHVTLDTQYDEAAGTAEVYAIVQYMQFRCADGGFTETGGSHVPTVLTFVRRGWGWNLGEYWEPRDGSYFTDDIRTRFGEYADEAMHLQRYTDQQMRECYAKVAVHEGVDVQSFISRLIETICATPEDAEIPYDHIAAHESELNRLGWFGDYTLRYVFSEFLNGGQDGLRGYVMQMAMMRAGSAETILNVNLSGQDYFDYWLRYILSEAAQRGMDWMRQSEPSGYLCLTMLDGYPYEVSDRLTLIPSGWSFSTDLDGDGREEEILLGYSYMDHVGPLRLTIGGQDYSEALYAEYRESNPDQKHFAICDLDVTASRNWPSWTMAPATIIPPPFSAMTARR